MHPFGECLGQPVGQGLQQDRAVVVEVVLELRDLVVAAQSSGDGEGADVVTKAGFLGRDEVTQRPVRDAVTVLALLASNPFPDHPPARVRAVLHAYRYTTPEERAATGDWWVRRELGLYFPPLGLDARGR
jgi:hypothetical protein